MLSTFETEEKGDGGINDQLIEETETIIVYFNDKETEKIDYKDADMQIDLPDDGIYCFMVLGKDDETVDITLEVQGVSYSDGGLTYLK